MEDKYYQSHFNYHVFFIGFYLSKQFRKLKIEADGINIIDIVVGGNMTPAVKIIDNRSIIHVPFDVNFYSSIDKHGKCIYYTQLVKEAFELLANVRDIPYCLLIDLINTLQHDNFEYRWKFKTISLPLKNLKIVNIDDLQHGRLNLQYCDTPYPDDKKSSDNFFMLQRELKYDNYDFK